MFNFDSLSGTAVTKIIHEISRTIENNDDICDYIISGKATYFGFDPEQELWEDRVLFRPNRDAQFVCCIDYISNLDDRQRAEKVTYMLTKLKTTFRDLQDEKVLEEVRKFISTFT